MGSDESPEYGNFRAASRGGGAGQMILTVPNLDALFARALAAGTQEVVAVEELYRWRVGRVADPFGQHWEISHPLAAQR